MPRRGDLGLRHANVVTMDPRQPEAEALVVREGAIAAVGSWDIVYQATSSR
jgi:predicted amidohydrolase YtcJ